MQHFAAESIFRHLNDAVTSSDALPQKADANARVGASIALVGPSEGDPVPLVLPFFLLRQLGLVRHRLLPRRHLIQWRLMKGPSGDHIALCSSRSRGRGIPTANGGGLVGLFLVRRYSFFSSLPPFAS